ncbi:MAG: hypothetical protein COW24_00615 [Candidatus Kerfeldbacteria bacterium CG15_BIG_FIL_POST_REV_8_21_14_020_45_12]|uniref:Anaphase-promoting complex subunit 4 WD40 domain-containing protein n=1 Tax=Candidatus Kerfeldbacteria bacterium CG15_BIG_FIL_POST_REV_8_21_14_020_45_12 TaxID=2014247 RepID=A0A2M7H557_9BACT|nr:MAG: hypothetical protein COW24_00615 [Candidatus Kerfeldbacteria bacterium CG15_BIG_FIL_POST_REV_8_21_14_020_45_12]PJA94077.1 MAG: hypothetical protein CO132_00065 [Candidatus Kerfeldbacteria bacterium CG_4_9_14_3_um_filter_45_8]
MKKNFLAIVIFSAFMATAGSAQAASLSQVGDLSSDAVSGKLMKYHGSLYTLTSSAEEGGPMSVYQSDADFENWVDVSAEETIFSEAVNSLTQLDFIRLYRGNFFLFGKNTAGDIEIWRKPSKSEDDFTKISTDFSPDSEITAVINKRTSPKQRVYKRRHPQGAPGRANQLIVITSSDEGAKLYTSKNGTSWNQAGVNGLIDDTVSNVTSVFRMPLGGSQKLIAGTSDGRLLISSISDLSTWEELEGWSSVDSSEVTAINAQSGKLVVATLDSDNQVRVYQSNLGSTSFEQVGDTGLGNDNTAQVTHLTKFMSKGPLFAATENGTDGAELYRWNHKDKEWVLVAGTDNENFALFSNVLRFKGTRYMLAENTIDGAEVFRLSK